MLDEVKVALRVSASAFNGEIEDLIDAARQDLILSGISSEIVKSDEDPLVRKAIKTYCKAHFGYDNPEADRFERSYLSIKQHLSLAGDYLEPPVV